MSNGSSPFFHILPWVIFIISILMLIFFIFSAYYGYQTGKIAGVSKFESTTLLISSIIFALLMVFLFIWSIVHLFRLYSGKGKKKEETKKQEEAKPAPAPTSTSNDRGRVVKVINSDSEANSYGRMETTSEQDKEITKLLKSSRIET